MKRIALNVQAISPLAIRSDHAPGGAETAKYISGTALAGSLAAIHRLYQPGDTENFERLFLKGRVQYPDLYPANFGNEEGQIDDMLPVYPLPKTAESCKRYSGFRSMPVNEKIDDPGHGVRDGLLDWAMYKLADRVKPVLAPSVLLDLFKKHEQCETCGKPMVPYSAYYRSKDGHRIIARPETRLQTHTGINRETGTVQESILYNRRVFEEQSRFWGMVRLNNELEPTFQQFIKAVGMSGLVRIGTGRTRGLGKVQLTSSLLEDKPDRFELFKERLDKFNTALRKRAELVTGFKPELAPFYFVLTLHSPAILCDELLRYRSTIDKDMLAKMLDIDQEENPFEVLYRSASTRRITGWNELWGTPRANEIAIDSGSVFLFESKKPLEDLAHKLYTLEEEGIGKRRAEGFGRVYISDPFHLEVELQ
jgi:CRISPR-associated protein Csx10